MVQEFQTIREQIENKLKESLLPEVLEVIDDSHKHIGHAGHNGVGESHFRIKITSRAFVDKSRIERHRMVYSILEEHIPPIHALQISANIP